VAGRGRRGFRLPRTALCMMIGTAMAAAAAACGTAAPPGRDDVTVLAAQHGTISETGSGLLYPLMRSWAAAYQQATAGVTVATASTGSGTGIADACETTPGCVSYNGISYLAQALAGGLGEAELANYADKFTLPAADSINASVSAFVSLTPPNETISMIDGPSLTGYPIVNYEYAVVSTRQPDAARASALKAFLHWIITAGNQPKYVDAVGFQPLPAAVVTLGNEQIGEIGS
jgi:ABC-type phosphate transport system substrate-binding protein